MPVGTRAELYIPYTMGYGVYGQGDIPGYTTLVFDLYLDGITHPAGPDDRKLKAAVSEEKTNSNTHFDKIIRIGFSLFPVEKRKRKIGVFSFSCLCLKPS